MSGLDLSTIAHLPVPLQILLVFAATFLQEDIAALAAGAALTEGKLGLVPAILGVGLGALAANLAFWLAGRLLGPSAFRLPGLRTAQRNGMVDKARAQFERSGFWAIAISRFVPGTRIPVCAMAGMLGMSFPRYLVYSLIAIVPWVTLMLWIPDSIKRIVESGGIWWLCAAAAVAVLVWLLRVRKPVVGKVE